MKSWVVLILVLCISFSCAVPQINNAKGGLLDEDGNISLNELVDYVELWLSGGISMGDVVEVIRLWRG